MACIIPFRGKVAEDNEGQLAAKDARFDELYGKHEALKRENVEDLDKKDRHHVQVTDVQRTMRSLCRLYLYIYTGTIYIPRVLLGIVWGGREADTTFSSCGVPPASDMRACPSGKSEEGRTHIDACLEELMNTDECGVAWQA